MLVGDGSGDCAPSCCVVANAIADGVLSAREAATPVAVEVGHSARMSNDAASNNDACAEPLARLGDTAIGGERGSVEDGCDVSRVTCS